MRFFPIILLAILSLPANLSQTLSDFQITTYPNENPSAALAILSSTGVISQYDYYSQLTSTCVLPKVQQDNETTHSRTFSLYNNNSFAINATISLNYDENSLKIADFPINSAKSALIPEKSAVSWTFPYDCTVNAHFLDNETVLWTLISLEIALARENCNETLSFQASFIKICQRSASDLYPFDASFAILAVLGMLIVFFGVRNQKITSFQQRFPSVCVQWWMSFVYILLMVAFLALWTQFFEAMQLTFYVLMVFLSLFAVTFTLKELLYYFKIFEICNLRVQVPKCPVSVHLLVCFALGCCVVLPWVWTSHYILTDFLALFIAFAGFKLFKIASLKHGTIFLVILAIYEIFEKIVFSFLSKSPLSSFYSSEFCYPLKLEIPTFDDFLTKRCSWLNITNLLFPGLFLSYFHRYDASKKVRIYFLMGFFGYLCGNLIWIAISLLFAYSSPLLVYTFPIMIGLCSLLAYKRNENLELWEGLFYDYDLVYANIKKKEGVVREMFEEKREIFDKQQLFEGLLDSSLDSIGSFEGKEEKEKELMVLQKKSGGNEENLMGKGDIKKKIKAFEGMKIVPGMSITNKEELEKVLRNKKQ